MNLIASIWNYKCPRCRQGDLFKSPFNMSKPLDMHDNCSVCNQATSPEPGYYYGAMFISYIWTSFSALGIVAICILLLGWSINASFAFLIALGVLSYFKVLRLSRSMYIHLDVKYKPEMANK